MNDFARRGLGRGLSTLLGEPARADFAPPQAPPAFTPVPVGPPVETPRPVLVEAPSQQPEPEPGVKESLRVIPVDLISANPNQPRKHFDEKELRELADSIRAHGVLQPILVRPMKGQNGRYEIVAGERRWRAAQMAGVHAIPAVTRELEELDVLEIAIIENVQRTDLNPIEEAQGFQALIDRFGRTQQEIADSVGKSRPHIANMLRLLALPEEILEMVRDGRLSAGHARAILTAPDPMALARLAIAQAMSVREVERLAQQAKEEKGLRVPTDKPEKDADTRALEGVLSQVLGLNVVINAKGEGGEVRIPYKKLEQLDDIVARLRGAA